MAALSEFFRRDWTDGETWAMRIIAALVTTAIIGGVGLVLEAGGEKTEVRALWEKNWLTINESRGHLGASDGSWTNREAFLATLEALNLAADRSLDGKRMELVKLINNAELHQDEPYYNLPYTSEIRALESELRRGIRDHAVDHGIDVQ